MSIAITSHTVGTSPRWSSLLATSNDLSLTLARVALGVVILPHGLQKLAGWFGGYGWSGTMTYLTEGVGLPWLIAAAVILLESVGALMLIAGVGVRFVALGIGAVMLGAILTTHAEHGFFMNWFGQQAGEGFEYHLLALGLAAALAVGGGGAFSVDRLAVRRLRR